MSISDDLITIVLVVICMTSIVIAVRNRRIQKRNEREAKAARDRENAIRLELPVIEAASPEVVAYVARREIMPVVAADPRSASVNGRAFLRAKALVEQFRALQHPGPRSSHPLAPFPATVETEAGKVEVLLGRDSENHRDYWVYYPRFSSTRAQAIGLISTDLLDAIELEPASAEAARA